jgi:hypothetical protein
VRHSTWLARTMCHWEEAEGSAVRLDGETELGGDSPMTHLLVLKSETQIPPLPYAEVPRHVGTGPTSAWLEVDGQNTLLQQPT